MKPRVFAAPAKAGAGDRVAILSPAFAAPAVSEAVHEQAMRRLTETTGLIPVEYATTRQLGASAQARAADINAAFADPSIRAVLATIGGNDQITVIKHIDAEVITDNPKPFLGYSDNTNLHNFLWGLGIPSYYGGSTQVHLGAGPRVDGEHLASLRAALIEGGSIELTDPGESEDFGITWTDPRALTHFGIREATEPWAWSGPTTVVEGRSWGGCLEVIDQIAMADRMPAVRDLEGAILLFETSEELPAADEVRRWVRALGERDPRSRRRRTGRPATSQPARRTCAGSGRTSPTTRGAERSDNRAGQCVQPGRGHLRRSSLRPHPTPMDPSPRRIDPARRNHQNNYR